MRRRVGNGTHPDLTWVRPTGAHVMRVEDVEGPVVSAATRTPFESKRRVFVLERVDTMNDEVANRLLKTLEEPAHFVHLILLTEALGRVLDTVDLPVPAGALRPAAGGPHRRGAGGRGGARGAGPAHAPGSRSATPPGPATSRPRRAASCAPRWGASWPPRSARTPTPDPWRPLLERAERARAEAEQEATAEREQRLELEPKGRERRAMEREIEEAGKREGRRARTRVLDLALTLTELSFRDLVCVAEGAPEAVLAVDRAAPTWWATRAPATPGGCARRRSAARRRASHWS